MNQSGFDNPHEDRLDAGAAAKLLGVKRATLYSYVSRGWIRAFPGERHRERLYERADLERLRIRADARLGHGAVAAGALRWGEPVMDSAITELRAEGPWYRGRSALELASSARFEQVAELLWTGVFPERAPRWTGVELGFDVRAFQRLVPRGSAPLAALLTAFPLWDAGNFPGSGTEELRQVRQLLRRMAGIVALQQGASVHDALAAPSLGASLARAWNVPRGRASERALDEGLILCADHELNVSSFAARIAASAGASLGACLQAALATFTGPRHGGESARVEALVRETGSPGRARATLRARAQRGEAIPGLGHPLYRQGDPRGARLLHTAQRLAPRDSGVRTVVALAEAARSLGMDGPTLDLGLVALVRALRLPEGAGSVLFCVGRTAGWVAHLQEQRASPVLLRPRARYVPGLEAPPSR